MQQRNAGLVAFASVLAMLVSLALAAPANAATSVTTVATGLDNPRGLSIGPGGVVYVAEAGRAGTQNCQQGPEGEQCLGFTGAITQIKSGHQQRIITGLASLGGRDGSFCVGADDLAFVGKGRIYVIMTSAGPDTSGLPQPAPQQLGNLLNFTSSGQSKNAGDIDNYEFAHDPDGRGPESNPYSATEGPGFRVVADAAGNDLLKVTDRGQVSLLAVFPGRTVNGQHIDSVPTSVARGPDGAFYVGELGGDGTPLSKARVWRVVPGQRPTVFASHFNTIIGLDFGPDGSLYVAELLKNGFPQADTGDLTGALIRIQPNGKRSELARGQLQSPGGVAVDRWGNVYVSTNSVFAGTGQVVRIAG